MHIKGKRVPKIPISKTSVFKQAILWAENTVAHSMGKKNLVKKSSSESFLPDLYFFGEPFAMPVESDKHRSNFLKIQNKYVLCNWAYIPSGIYTNIHGSTTSASNVYPMN